MHDDPTKLAARVAAIREENDLVTLLESAGRRITPVALESFGREGFSDYPGLSGVLLNPGEGALLWAVRSSQPVDGRTLARALRNQSKRAAAGCAAAFLIDGKGVDLYVALANETEVEHCRVTPRGVDLRSLDAWSALAANTNSALACIRAFRLLRKRALGAAFFRDVREALGVVTSSWLHGPSDPAARHALSITFLCRMMFLYFVQQKEWLDGDSGFMAALVLDPRAENIYSDRLAPLFFDVLNRPVADRAAQWRSRAIPFLNGGLFTRSPQEQRSPRLDLPDSAIRGLVAGALERYRFTEVEGEECAGIDPEMLGSVFETLMHRDTRGSSGTFYTPVRLVAECVHDALGEALTERLGAELASRLLAGEPIDAVATERSRVVLDELAVLDPAMGSGAFILGVLDRLTRVRTAVFGESRAVAMRAVISRNLYGVDISESAVTIAELRVWLALAGLLPDGPAQVAPLPNLGHRLRRGNALLGSTVLAALDGVRAPIASRRRLERAASRFGAAHGEAKVAIAQEIREAETEVALALLDAAEKRETDRLAELDAKRGPDLFGHRTAWSIVDSREARACEARRDEAARRRAAALAGDWSPAFDFDVHFAPVMGRGGFDVVVGNPPWVRLSRVPADERRRLRERYRWMADAGAGRPFGAQPDLSVAFVARSVELLRVGGAFALVLPGKLFTAGYASAMRAGLVAEMTVTRLRDLAESPVAHFGADVFPGVIVARKTPGSAGALVRIDDGAGRRAIATQCRLAIGADARSEWPLLDAAAVDVCRRLDGQGSPLGERFDMRTGIKTGANAVFIDQQKESDMNVRVLKGADVRPMRASASGTILFAHDKVRGDVLPGERIGEAEHGWFEHHRPILEGRADARGDDPIWRVHRVTTTSLGHRVVWRDIGERLDAAYVPPVSAGGPVALNTTYCVAVRDARQGVRLAAWLCSTPIRFFAAARAERALSGYRRFMLRNVACVPIVRDVVEGSPMLDDLAARLQLAPDDAACWVELDRLVAGLLGLNETDLATIRGETARLSLRSRDLAIVAAALGQ